MPPVYLAPSRPRASQQTPEADAPVGDTVSASRDENAQWLPQAVFGDDELLPTVFPSLVGSSATDTVAETEATGARTRHRDSAMKEADVHFKCDPTVASQPPQSASETDGRDDGESPSGQHAHPHNGHPVVYHRAEAPLRSYSLMDIENDAFTGIHEDDVENAMGHCLRNLQSVFSLLLLCLGTSLLLHWPEMRNTSPLLFYYILGSMLAEVVLVLCLGCFMCLMTCLVGEDGAAYGSVMCGLLHRVAEGATHYTLTGVGAYALYNFSDLESLLFQSEEHIREKFNWLLVYVGCEVVISLLYSLQTLGTLFGILKFVLVKIYAKLTGRGEVQFQQGDGPIIYASIDQYRRALPTMRNPVEIAFARHHQRSPQASMSKENGGVVDLEMSEDSSYGRDTARSTQPLLVNHR
ncbi:conserved hypothetical protein [Neospora caninum Liverpool]|uniref:Transmembrane protein n=1 Tax=Neospora caninum (strain Liverpool) TaxID=572307 RepID=F0VER5_NEOCL|nr:conserved hypothetical protein [Neospora caninum Liverpool]CBZ52209.1 conserved hypothetical protein [Neospora caninum Liverpool]CEL66176.1 TPA: hypothetical protein BN1204_019980 [Neospora caninum Liverpool]|eukprot:XP_003882241.1 conserved hypothetical protein [Neospora caninum Liverpool]